MKGNGRGGGERSGKRRERGKGRRGGGGEEWKEKGKGKVEKRRGCGVDQAQCMYICMHSVIYIRHFQDCMYNITTNPTYLQYNTGLPDPVSSAPCSGNPHLISRRRGVLIIAHCLAPVVINWSSG